MSNMRFFTYYLKDICDIKSGKRLPANSDFSKNETQYRYIRARDIKNGKISENELAFLDADTQSKIKKYIINEGDIAITIVANIGDVGYCTKALNGANLTENAVRLTNFDKDKVDSKFLNYYLSQPSLKQYMENLAAGAAQAKLGIYKINKIKVLLPDVDTQKQIAYSIEKYDYIIENNNKRIKILEEMAENLYKEWFVRFRFPGYENAEFENGIPKGWKIGRLTDILTFHDAKRKPVSSIERMNREKIYPYYGAAELMDYIDDYIFDGRYLLMGEDGSVITKEGYPVLQFVEGKFWVNNHAHVISGSDAYPINFIYLLLKQLSIIDIVTGVAQPKISMGRMKKKKIIIPDLSIIQQFNKIIQSVFDEIFILKKNIEVLKKQRDSLLPKLMSGKLEIK